MADDVVPSLPEYTSGTDSEVDEDIKYPSDTEFELYRDIEILAMLSKHRRTKRRSGLVMDCDARRELVHQVAFSSCIYEIMVDCFAMDVSTEHLHVTWEAIQLNPKNDLVWESRLRILVGLDKLHEELAFLNSIYDDGAMLDNELFWNHILSIVEKLGTEAVEQQQFAISIMSSHPHMDAPWAFMVKSLCFLHNVNVPSENLLTKKRFPKEDEHCDNLLRWMNQTLAGVHCRNILAWSYRKSLISFLPAAARQKELKFLTPIMDKDPSNNCAWLYLLWFCQMYVKEFGVHTIDTQLRDVTDVFKCRDNKHAWFYRQWLVAETHKNGGKSTVLIIHEECELTAKVLADNIKNIYAWFHRKWTLERFGGWEDELLFCRQLLVNDIRNALAWNQKAFVINKLGEQVSEASRKLELEFCREAIQNDSVNEFPWMYLTCLYQDLPFVHQIIQLVCESIPCVTMEDPLDVFNNRRWCVNALGTVLRLISLGYKPKEKVCGVVTRLCSNIKLAADIITDPPCPNCANKCTICFSCFILVLQHLDMEAHCPWTIVHGQLNRYSVPSKLDLAFTTIFSDCTRDDL